METSLLASGATRGRVVRSLKVEGPDACADQPDGKGWYYEGDRLVACDATCDVFKSSGGGVDVVLGCPTLI